VAIASSKQFVAFDVHLLPQTFSWLLFCLLVTTTTSPGLPPQPPCHQLKIYNTKRGESGSNPQPQPTKDCVLPLGYFTTFVLCKHLNSFVHKTNHMFMINKSGPHRHTELKGCCSLSVTASPHLDLAMLMAIDLGISK
jgi:hypothetical protein